MYGSPQHFKPLLAAAAEPRRGALDGRGNLSQAALHDLFLTGMEMERGDFKRMTGLGERTAVTVLGALVKRGLLRSDTVQGRLRFGMPLHALRFYFPALWPEAEADTA